MRSGELVSVAVGVAGLGRMGSAVAERLLETGFRVVVWNRSPGKTEALERAGAAGATTCHDLVEACDVVLTLVRDDAAARDVYLSAEGLCTESAQGRLFIEMSTLMPGTVRELHARARGCGASVIDAPVSGTVEPARKGALVALVGGDDGDVERALPILEALTRKIIRAGPVGQGALLKLVVNLPLAVYWHSLADALALGEAGGLDRRLMVETVADSAAALAVLKMKIPSIMGESPDVAFDIASMRKDLLSIIETSATLGSNTTAALSALGAYSAAVAAGFGDEDAVAITRLSGRRPAHSPSSSRD